jgi:hypothetical protein
MLYQKHNYHSVVLWGKDHGITMYISSIQEIGYKIWFCITIRKCQFKKVLTLIFFSVADGLNDCEDPDCCISISCKDAYHCVTAPDPMEILLRKQPPSSTASFYDRMRFLVEDESVQSYATLTSFNQRWGGGQNGLLCRWTIAGSLEEEVNVY